MRRIYLSIFLSFLFVVFSNVISFANFNEISKDDAELIIRQTTGSDFDELREHTYIYYTEIEGKNYSWHYEFWLKGEPMNDRVFGGFYNKLPEGYHIKSEVNDIRIEILSESIFVNALNKEIKILKLKNYQW